MNINVIGAGRLGKNIAFALYKNELATIQAICNRSMSSSSQVCQEIGSGRAVAELSQLPPAEITWITCSDDNIPLIVQQLTRAKILPAGSFVIHCSGALSSELLKPLQQQGCFIASMHPLKAFRASLLDLDAFRDVYCVIEGDAPVCAWLTKIMNQLQAIVLPITSEAKKNTIALQASPLTI